MEKEFTENSLSDGMLGAVTGGGSGTASNSQPYCPSCQRWLMNGEARSDLSTGKVYCKLCGAVCE